MISTNQHGEFIINFNKEHNSSNELIFSVLESNGEYVFELDEFPEISKKEFTYSKFSINETFKEEILQRSIYNQIENSYYSVKPDTINISAIKKNPFYGTDFKTYILDEYTRFPTVKETIIEVTNDISIRKNTEGKSVFSVKSPYRSQENNLYPPMVIIDGIHIENHMDVISYDSKKIDRINYLQDTYYLGSETFEGIISIKTFNKHYLNYQAQINSLKINLNRPNPIKKYFKQNYTELNLYSKIPDYRNQLLWEPNIDLKKNINFYTSDNIGEYLIVLEGVSNKGKPVYLEKTIVVK